MRISLTTIMLTLACTSRPLAQDDEAGTTTNPGTTDDASEDEATGDASEGMGTFARNPDMPDSAECGIFEQDCPDGEKCVPYASNGESWDTHKCMPVLGDQAPGEACSSLRGVDVCDATSVCWESTCYAQCTGTADMPQCPPGSTCFLDAGGVFANCAPDCDPVAQECGEGLGCFWAGILFDCYVSVVTLPTGQPCGYINDCAPGHLCADAASLPSCAGSACCTQYCNLPDGDAGCVAQPGTACLSFFDEGMAPPAYEHVGVCVVPP